MITTVLTTVDTVLEECDNCLPNNKLLGVKDVLIVFVSIYQFNFK